MRKLIYILALLSISVAMSAQTDRKEVRSGNRQFRRENYKEAEISYRKALVKDSLSFAANYNLANVLYRGEHYDEAGKILETVRESAPASEYGADYFFNAGDIALAKKDYAAAVDAFKQSLLLNPGDLQAKENYIYARKMLENQQQNGGGQDNQQNQDDQQNQDNQDNHQDRNDNQQNQDQQNQDQQNNQDQQDSQDGRNGQQPQPVKISPQQAQQMLKAMQAKEKETQDKVNREKAEALKSRQKEKNW